MSTQRLTAPMCTRCAAVRTGSDHLQLPPRRAPSSTRSPSRRFAITVRAPSSRASSPADLYINPGITCGKPQKPPAGNNNSEAAAATSARANPQQPAPIRDSQRQPASIHLIGGPICLAQCCGKMLPRLVCISREGICLECATCECASRARSPLRICGVERAFVARIVYISKYSSSHLDYM